MQEDGCKGRALNAWRNVAGLLGPRMINTEPFGCQSAEKASCSHGFWKVCQQGALGGDREGELLKAFIHSNTHFSSDPFGHHGEAGRMQESPWESAVDLRHLQQDRLRAGT